MASPRISLIWLALSSAFCLAMSGQVVLDGSFDVSVHILGLDTDSGRVYCAAWNNKESFPKDDETFAAANAQPAGLDTVCVFEDLGPGTFAFSAYHDKNGSGEIDKGAFGRPTEPFGFSNGVKVRFAPPRFDPVAVDVQSAEQRIEILVE